MGVEYRPLKNQWLLRWLFRRAPAQECGTASSFPLSPSSLPHPGLLSATAHLHPPSCIRAAAHFCHRSEILWCGTEPLLLPASSQGSPPCSAAPASSFSQFVWSQPARMSFSAAFLSEEAARISLACSSPHLRFVIVSAAA